MQITRNSLKSSLVALLSVVLVGVGVAPVASAASPSIYLSPSSKSVNNGQAFTVAVHENSAGSPIDTVHVCLSYDSSKLSLVNTSSPVAPFDDFNHSNSCGGFDRAEFDGQEKSDNKVATLTFKAKVSTGTDTISLSGSALAYAGTDVSSLSTGRATISFTASSSKSKPSKEGSGGHHSSGSTNKSNNSTSSNTENKSSTSKKPTTKKKKSDVKKPSKTTMTSVKSEQHQYSIAQLTLTSKNPTSIYIRYSTDKAHFQKTQATSFAKEHTISLGQLTPGTTYYYQVISKNKDGKTTTSPLKTFSTKGMSVSVKVYDKNHQPLKNQEVTLHSVAQTATTNDNGVATFSNVVPGQHHLSYSSNGQTYEKSLSVTNNVVTNGDIQTAPTQKFSVAFPVEQGGLGVWLWVIVIVAVIIICAILYLVFRKRSHGSDNKSQPGAVSAGPGVATSAKSDNGGSNYKTNLSETKSAGSMDVITPNNTNESDKGD